MFSFPTKNNNNNIFSNKDLSLLMDDSGKSDFHSEFYEPVVESRRPKLMTCTVRSLFFYLILFIYLFFVVVVSPAAWEVSLHSKCYGPNERASSRFFPHSNLARSTTSTSSLPNFLATSGRETLRSSGLKTLASLATQSIFVSVLFCFLFQMAA